MTARWALAFALPGGIAMAVAAQVRAYSRRGIAGVRRRGALVIAGAGLCGWLLLPALPGRLAVIGAAALALALFGAAFVDRPPPRAARVGALVAAALAAVAAGVRFEWSGVGPLDVAGTAVGLVVVALAFRWLDATDGPAPAMSVVIFFGVFSLGAFGDQGALATMAIATAGASVGFLAFAFPPASLQLNEDGALFLGFLVAALAIEVHPAIGPPGDLAVPLLLLAVPLLEITLVPAAQSRRRKRVGPGRRDHLVHRLRVLGLSPVAALGVLLGAQLLLVALAVFVGRGIVPPVFGIIGGAVVIAAIAIAALRKDVYGERVFGFSRRVKLVTLGLAAVAALVTVPSVIAAARVRNALEDARASIERGLDAARLGDARNARARFAAAATEFEDARASLDNPLVSPGLALPIVGSNLQAARAVATTGRDIATTGQQTAKSVNPDRLRVVDGTVPLAEVQRVTPDIERGAQQLRRAVRQLDAIDRGFLLSPVSRALDKVDRRLTTASREADDAAAAARVAPAILGGNGTRRYLLTVQNGAEWRATGGFIGNWGILTSENGHVHLDRFEEVAALNPPPGEDRMLNAPADYVRRYEQFSPARTWQNINMSPDFPTVAQVMADQYRQATGEQVDGNLAVDPQGLAALLRLTGPVSVPGWPEPLTADNVVRVTLNDAYVRFAADRERKDFLGDVARAVVDRSTDVPLGNPARIARVLGRAARQGHLILAFSNPREEALAVKLGVAGKVPAVRGDSLLVTAQNAAGNKIDYYLRRRLTQTIRLDPVAGGGEAHLAGRLDVTLENTAPTTGLPATVIGPYDERFAAGENRTYLSIYTPLGMTAATLDGNRESLDSGTELDRHVYAGFLDVPAGTSRTLALDLTGSLRADGDGWYTLDLVRQPGVAPDHVTVNIELPPGWRIADGRGLDSIDGNRATAHLALHQSTRLRVRPGPATDNIWQRLIEGQ